MSKQIKQETSITEDIFTGIGSLLGSAIGVTAEVTKDAVVGIVYDMPKAIVEGFQEPKFSFGDDEPEPIKEEAKPVPEKVEPVVITKEEYREQLAAELAKVDEAIEADDTVEVKITESKNDNA